MTSSITSLRQGPWGMRALLVLLALAFVGVLGARFGIAQASAGRSYQVPQNARMEAGLGVRFTSAQLVGDGGLVELRYVVLDNQKASRFQNDVHHPPVIYDGRDRKAPVYRTALMKQGHTLRPGQTYFILYANNTGVVHRGDSIEIDAGGGKLVDVPVR